MYNTQNAIEGKLKENRWWGNHWLKSLTLNQQNFKNLWKFVHICQSQVITKKSLELKVSDFPPQRDHKFLFFYSIRLLLHTLSCITQNFNHKLCIEEMLRLKVQLFSWLWDNNEKIYFFALKKKLENLWGIRDTKPSNCLLCRKTLENRDLHISELPLLVTFSLTCAAYMTFPKSNTISRYISHWVRILSY